MQYEMWKGDPVICSSKLILYDEDRAKMRIHRILRLSAEIVGIQCRAFSAALSLKNTSLKRNPKSSNCAASVSSQKYVSLRDVIQRRMKIRSYRGKGGVFLGVVGLLALSLRAFVSRAQT